MLKWIDLRKMSHWRVSKKLLEPKGSWKLILKFSFNGSWLFLEDMCYPSNICYGVDLEQFWPLNSCF